MWNFDRHLIVIDFSLNSVVVRTYTSYDFNILNTFEVILWPSRWSILEYILCALESICYHFWSCCSRMLIRLNWLIVFIFSVCLRIFKNLLGLAINEREVLTFPAMIANLSISPFVMSNLPSEFETLLQGTY